MSEPTLDQVSARRWIAPFTATTFAMMTLQMSSLGFAPLLPDIQRDFGISYSQVGLFSGVYGLVAIVFSVPGGMLAKRFGEKNMLSLGLLVVTVGLVLLSRAPNFAWGLSSRTIWIIGYRVAFVCIMTAISLVVPSERRSTAMGILGAMSSLASVIGAPFGTAIGVAFGWRNGILAFAGMAVLGSIVFWTFYPTPRAAAQPSTLGHGLVQAPDASTFTNPLVWSMVLLGLTNMGGFSSTFFVPFAVKATFNLGPPVAAYIISAAYVTAIFANLLCGYLADRLNRWGVLIGLMLVLIPACFAMMASNLFTFRVATALVISLGLCATNQIYAIASEVMPGREMGPVMGIVSLGGGIFGYVGPQTLGVLRDRTGSFTAGWYFVAFGALISLVVILILKRATSKDHTSQMQVFTGV
ncbi:MAG TPA: MFS transporter [Candidatus Acidoferrales bacterium]|nr:MFS transporter [Candidatus Acidoferrales bacterium]